MIYGRCLMSQNHMSQSITFSVNRFLHCGARRFWQRNGIFVPLYCQKLSSAAATIKTKICED